MNLIDVNGFGIAAETPPIRLDLSDKVTRLVEAVPTQVIQKRITVGDTRRQLHTTLRVAASLAAFDRMHMRLRQTDDTIVHASRLGRIHLLLLTIHFVAH